MRNKAGHGWTCVGHKTWIINDAGEWIPSGKAAGWPRCSRCRRPHENSPFSSGLCSTCYFLHKIDVQQFWKLHNEGYWLAPYNIGSRARNAEHPYRKFKREGPEMTLAPSPLMLYIAGIIDRAEYERRIKEKS